ncbi:MAG: hypothetical protein ACRD2L_13290 [Terriglobia bacterium]
MATSKGALGLVLLALVLSVNAQTGLPQTNDLPTKRVVVITEAQNESYDHDVESLRGLGGIGVSVMNPYGEAIQDGLTQAKLRAEIESTLRQGGITILSGQESQQAGSLLFVNARTAKNHEDDSYIWNIEVSVKQNVRLDHDPSVWVQGARTWNRGGFGSGPTSHMSRTILRAVGRFAESFVRDYQSVNPQQ